jgi:hypothetical protein
MLIYWQIKPRVKSHRPNSLGRGEPSGLPQTIDHGLADLNNKSEFLGEKLFPSLLYHRMKISFPVAP